MEREAGINNVMAKQRLRDAIQDEVRQYLERGGRITVVQPPDSASACAAHGGIGAGRAGDSGDIMTQLD
jgi:hypothetical protein